MEVLVEDFLGERIAGQCCLDAGCGLGFFTKALLARRPARVSACDISSNLVQKLSGHLPDVECFTANILEMSSALDGRTFDIVVCSDVIEHTPDPARAVQELARAVAPRGLLSISVPNQRWRWLLSLAQTIGLRKKYEGHENWVRPEDLKIWLQEEGFEVQRAEGIHTIPFKLFPHTLLRKLDKKFRYSNYAVALNLAILAKKNR